MRILDLLITKGNFNTIITTSCKGGPFYWQLFCAGSTRWELQHPAHSAKKSSAQTLIHEVDPAFTKAEQASLPLLRIRNNRTFRTGVKKAYKNLGITDSQVQSSNLKLSAVRRSARLGTRLDNMP